MGNHQLIIFTRLLQAIAGMQSIDELLQWSANILVQRLELEVVQIWTLQDNRFKRIPIELCTTACRQPDIPEQVVINSHVAEVAKRFCNEHYTVTIPQVTEAIFSSQAAHLLTKYNLNYWACYQLTHGIPIQAITGYQYPLNRFYPPTHTLVSFLHVNRLIHASFLQLDISWSRSSVWRSTEVCCWRKNRYYCRLHLTQEKWKRF